MLPCIHNREGGGAKDGANADGVRTPVPVPTVHNTVPDIVRQMSAVGAEGTIGPMSANPGANYTPGSTIGRQHSIGRRTSASV